MGHRLFVEKIAQDVSMQIRNGNYETGFIPVVEIQDLDLTVHENMNQLIMNCEQPTQRSGKVDNAQAVLQSPAISEILDSSDIPADVLEAGAICVQEPLGQCPTLPPHEVSRTITELEEEAASTESVDRGLKNQMK